VFEAPAAIYDEIAHPPLLRIHDHPIEGSEARIRTRTDVERLHERSLEAAGVEIPQASRG
jgi:hypothetical protein